MTDFARFALVFAATALLQLLPRPDGRGGRRQVRQPLRRAGATGARFQRLFELGARRQAASAARSARSRSSPRPRSRRRSGACGGLAAPLLVAALIPLVQAPEGMASAALLHPRTATTCAARCLALVDGAAARRRSRSARRIGVDRRRSSAIVLAQVGRDASTVSVGRPRRAPPLPAVPGRAARRRPRRRSAPSRSSRRSPPGSRRCAGCLPTVLVGVVATASQVGYFRIAQAPQTAFASLSAPARLVLLAEQTRDFEHGRARPRLSRSCAATSAARPRSCWSSCRSLWVCDAVADPRRLRGALPRRDGRRRG